MEFLLPSDALKCVPPTLRVVIACFKFFRDIASLNSFDFEWRKQGIKSHVIPAASDIDVSKRRLFKKILLVI